MHTGCQPVMGELVEHVEHSILASSIVDAVLDEVIGPDMISVLRPQRCTIRWSARACLAWALMGPSAPRVARYA